MYKYLILTRTSKLSLQNNFVYFFRIMYKLKCFIIMYLLRFVQQLLNAVKYIMTYTMHIITMIEYHKMNLLIST